MRSSPSTCLPSRVLRVMALATALIVPALVEAGADGISVVRAERLDRLLRQDCGSCHGMTMKGGLGPPLLPATLKDRDEDGLVQMILYGNPAKAMPPWGPLIGEAEARWIVRRLKTGMDKEGEPR